ncbi:MAG: putative metal-binding protein (TIGR02443 family) [Lentisphaeria bacterium]|jgi:uncharacterized metal-binding protein (TIGR02443 family)
MAVKKQFIAGAVCPKCATLDRVVVYREEDNDYRECVECGFNEKMIFKPQTREINTRVNQSEAEVLKQTQVLNFPHKA